jgi:hypothetical protein
MGYTQGYFLPSPEGCYKTNLVTKPKGKTRFCTAPNIVAHNALYRRINYVGYENAT